MKAAPLPWRVGVNGFYDPVIYDANGQSVCPIAARLADSDETRGEHERQIAAFIVQRANGFTLTEAERAAVLWWIEWTRQEERNAYLRGTEEMERGGECERGAVASAKARFAVLDLLAARMKA